MNGERTTSLTICCYFWHCTFNDTLYNIKNSCPVLVCPQGVAVALSGPEGHEWMWEYATENTFGWLNERTVIRASAGSPRGRFNSSVSSSSQWMNGRNVNRCSSDQYSISFTYLAVLDEDTDRGRWRHWDTDAESLLGLRQHRIIWNVGGFNVCLIERVSDVIGSSVHWMSMSLWTPGGGGLQHCSATLWSLRNEGHYVTNDSVENWRD